MKVGNVVQYLRRMSISIVLMSLITLGIYLEDPPFFLQPMYIILIVLGLQFGYQIFRSTRSRGVVDANMRDATRARRAKILFQATERDVDRVKGQSGDGMGMGSKMMIMLLIPLVIFFVSGQALGLVPGVEPWLSYMVGFLLSMIASTFLTVKMGIAPGTVTVTPKSYVVVEKGIAFDHMGQSFILRFPLTSINVQKEKSFIEAGAKSEASIIPNKLKLFSKSIDKLDKILAKKVVSDEHSK